MKFVALFAALTLAACATPVTSPGQDAPFVDYHQHLVSPAFAPIVTRPPRDGEALLAEMDAAGVRKAIVLSMGYSFGDERKKVDDPDRRTREENDWTSAQIVRGSGRLIGFCSANPLREAAVQELQRCLALPGMRGIKQHLGNGGVTLRNPEHLARMQQVFALAQRLRSPVLIHMRARGGANYGAEDARLFLDQIVPVAPDIDIIVAHFGYTSPGYGPADDVMTVFAEAAQRNDKRMRNLYIDVAANVHEKMRPEEASLIVQRIRQVGTRRILYGSDLSPPGGSIGAGWDIFRTKLPLTEAEIRTIARNRLQMTR